MSPHKKQTTLTNFYNFKAVKKLAFKVTKKFEMLENFRKLSANFEFRQKALDFTLKDECSEEQMEEQPPEPEVEISCLPPEMLQEILKKVKCTNTLKNCRLVSQNWKDNTSSILGSSSTIHLGSFYKPNSVAGQVRATFSRYASDEVSNKSGIIRSITTGTTARRKCFKLVQWSNLTNFCEKFGSQVKEMTADCDFYNCQDFVSITSMHRILTQLVPNLQVLNLTRCCGDYFRNDAIGLPLKNPVHFASPLLNLRVINITFMETIIHVHFRTYLAKIIQASSNLERVTILGDFHPNLSKHKKIKHLNLKGVAIQQNCRIVQQVSNSLETLTLDRYYLLQNDLHAAPLTTPMPNFLHLKKISLTFTPNDMRYTWHKYPENFLTDLIKKSPYLHTLELHAPVKVVSYTNWEELKNLEVHLRVKKLVISDIGTEAVLGNIMRKFPNLTDLVVTIGKRSFSPGRIEQRMFDIIETCSKHQLLHLRIQIHGGYVLSSLRFCFSRVPDFFNTLQTLAIENMNGLGTDSLTTTSVSDFEEALLMARSLKSFKMSRFRMHIPLAIRITNFVKENNLNVEFPLSL